MGKRKTSHKYAQAVRQAGRQAMAVLYSKPNLNALMAIRQRTATNSIFHAAVRFLVVIRNFHLERN